MKAKTKAAKQREAADLVAEIMYASLQELPPEEQKTRVRAIQKIKITRNGNEKTPKRAPTPENFRVRSQAVVVQRKRARR